MPKSRAPLLTLAAAALGLMLSLVCTTYAAGSFTGGGPFLLLVAAPYVVVPLQDRFLHLSGWASWVLSTSQSLVLLAAPASYLHALFLAPPDAQSALLFVVLPVLQLAGATLLFLAGLIWRAFRRRPGRGAGPAGDHLAEGS